MKDSYIGQAWLVLALSLVFGGLLAGVQAGLGPLIEANKKAATYDQIPDLVPGADAGKTVEIDVDGKVAYEVFDADSKSIGWVIKGAGQGFADKIEVLIGLSTDGQWVSGMYVLDQKETPALGDRIREVEFRSQFAGKPTAEPLNTSDAVSSASGSGVIAVTGATVSSEAVCTIVNKAAAEFKLWLEARDAGQPQPEEN